VSSDPLPYREFYYPLNVFMHILTHEEGGVSALHYGLFASPDEGIAAAQERSTAMLLERLPPPPARLLEAGIGLGTTLELLTRIGYDVTGITPDAQQIAMVNERYGDAVRVRCAKFEEFDEGATYDAIVFQESSQYIASEALFARAKALAPLVVVLDEFSLKPIDTPGALHALSEFLEAADRHGFEVTEEVDLSAQAAPSIDYFTQRFPRYRNALIADLGLTSQQVDELIAGGVVYSGRYADGTYGYRLLRLERRT